jgi:hypothetical protein
MSDAMIANFTQQAQFLSYDDTLTVISILLEKLKRHENKTEKKVMPEFLTDIFAIADKEPNIHKSEGKWSRDELYRY